MKSKLILFLFFLTLIFTCNWSLAKAGKDISKEDYINSLFYVSIGYPFNISPGGFFDVYNDNSFFGGKEDGFSGGATYGAGIKVEAFGNFRIGVAVNYYKSELKEEYTQKIIAGQSAERTIYQNFDIKTIPIMLTLDYIPFPSQFRTYTGIGVGAIYSKVYWREDINSDFDSDIRKGGVFFDDSFFSPGFRLYAGLELGFDKNRRSEFLGSLIIEASYTYINRSIAIFKETKEQFSSTPNSFNENYSLVSGYIGLNMAISFNFNLVNQFRKK